MKQLTYVEGNLARSMEPGANRRAFAVVEGGLATVICVSGHRAANVQKTPVEFLAHDNDALRIDNLHNESAPSRASLSLFGAIALAVIVSLALTVCITSFNSYAWARESVTSQLQTQEVTVRRGDGLWQLAERYPVEGLSTQELVDLISEQNQLEGKTLYPGQHIDVFTSK